MESANAQQELQKIMYQADVYKQQIGSLNEQINMVELTIKGMESTIEALTSLNKTKIGTEILVPLGSNCFAHGKLADDKNVIVGIGAGVSAEKSIPDAIKFFDKHLEQLNTALAEMQKKSVEIEKNLIQLNAASEKLVKGAQGQI